MNNPSAFPQVESRQVGEQGEYHMEIESYGGMTLRDYFAAKAMAAILSLERFVVRDELAAKAYDIADHMLKAREH